MDEKYIRKYERKTQMRQRDKRPFLEKLKLKAQTLYDKFEALVNGQSKLRKKSGNIAGVSATLAEYLEVNPALIRLGFVVGVFISWTTILIYAALAFIIPSVSKPDTKELPLESDWIWDEDEEKEPAYYDLKLCESCTTALKPNAKFCHNCGEPVG
jgi:phage shock protein PspC (stress-responsive transcriptional regulator)